MDLRGWVASLVLKCLTGSVPGGTMQHGKKTRHLLSRRWARSAALVVIVAAGALAASALLIEDEPDSREVDVRPTVVAVAPTPAAKTPAAPRYGPPKPARAADPARPARAPAKRPEPTPRPAPKGDPAERVRALRELELRDPAAAARTAAGLVSDPVDLVRVNAVAVLTRSSAPEAARALASLDPESRRLADALKGRK